MRRTSSSSPLLSHAFKAAGRFAPFGRLTLYTDRIERSTMGRVQETIALSEIEDVHWQTSHNDAPNFSLVLRGGRVVSGHLQGAGLWKTHLSGVIPTARPRRTPRERKAVERTAA